MNRFFVIVTFASVLSAAALATAAELFDAKLPDCSDELYLEFTKNGNRTRYQDPYFRLTDTLERLVRSESSAHDDRVSAKLAEFLDYACTLRSWTLPAHDGELTCFNGKPHIDLGAARIGLVFARALAVAGERLPETTRARAKSELERRVFAPYLATARGISKPNGHWWFHTENNWNAVCHSCVVRAALAYYPEGSKERAEILKAAQDAVPFFLKGFTDDGYCSEGAGYWNYGYGHFLEMGVALREAPEKIDLFAKYPKTETIARYGFTYKLADRLSPWFADGGGSPQKEYLDLCSKIWPGLALGLGARDAFPLAQVWIARPAAGEGLTIGCKGGHNDEFHNHNDVGSYDIAVGGEIVTGDPGGEEYTRRTFSGRRYESKVLNSYAHPVPRVAGALQGTGRKFAAKVVHTEFTDARDVIVLDLKGAYPVPQLVSLERTFVYDRGERKITVTDRVRFSEPSSFEDPLVTLGGFGDGVVRGEKGAELKVETSAKGGEWKWWEETVENPNRTPVKIRGVKFASVTEAEVTFKFR